MKRLGIAVMVSLVLAFVACKKSESVPVGGECSSRDDCQNRNDCMQVGDKKQCTKTCLPSASDCPAGTTCQSVSLSVDVPGKTVTVPKMNYCLK